MRKLFIKQSYVPSFKNQNKFFIYPTSVAMVTRRRTIDRVHFAPFGLFLAISGFLYFYSEIAWNIFLVFVLNLTKFMGAAMF